MRHRGRSRRLSPEQVACAVSLGVVDFAALYGVSPRIVRRWVRDGLPVLRFPGKLAVLRVEGGAWVEQHFRSDRVARVVDEVLADFRPLADASKRLSRA